MATVATRIGLADHDRTMTMEKFLEAEEDPRYRHELARGVLEVTYVSADPHGQVVWNLYRMATRHDQSYPGVIQRPGGGGELRLWMPAMVSSRNPDFAVVLRATPKDEHGLQRPVLAAEVVSKSSFDRDHQAKREEYLAYGLLEYWILDYLERKMTLLVRRGDTWVERPCPEGQPISSLVLPGLAATLADLWADLGEYGPEATED